MLRPTSRRADGFLLPNKKRGCSFDEHPPQVREMRFELTHRNRHYPLKVACLPIPPPAHLFCFLLSCLPIIGARDRNRTCTSFEHSHLKRARLPIPPPGRLLTTDFTQQDHLLNKGVETSHRPLSIAPLERKTGLEPATLTLARLCSTN